MTLQLFLSRGFEFSSHKQKEFRGTRTVKKDDVDRFLGVQCTVWQMATDMVVLVLAPRVHGKWKMENGKWKMENGEWRMENGNWKNEK
jgi:hypothetical protein